MVIYSGEVELLAAGIGAVFRTIRRQWHLSLREVEERSLRIAWERGDLSYQVSASWLDRLERSEHELTVTKLIALAEIYCIPTDQLIRAVHSRNARTQILDQLSSPNSTILLTEGIQGCQAEVFRPDTLVSDQTPHDTALLPKENGPSRTRYLWAIIGRCNLELDPMIPAGSYVQIDTSKREISRKEDWTHSWQRPIYFLKTRTGASAAGANWMKIRNG
jgi:hypothetical protein